MRKVFLGLLVIVIVCSCSEKKESRDKAPINVTTQIASPAFVDDTQSYVGIVEEREGIAVSFTGMGVVKRVAVNEGQAVAKGQLLAEMDDTQARNLLAGAEASMTQANDALTRYQMLHDSGSLPEVQWVEIQSKVAQAKSQLEVAKKNLADCKLTAPVSGIIGTKMMKAGETALPSQAVVTILDISSVKIKVAVPEAEIGDISANTTTTVKVGATDLELKGGRIEKGVVADALTHTYDVRINVENKGRKLLPGMVADVKFTTSGSQSDNSRSLPVTAVQKASDGSLFVWTVDKDNKAHRTKVTIGEMKGNHVAISDGIGLGQRVITEGYQKLSEGTKVTY